MNQEVRDIVMNYTLFDDNFWKEVLNDKECVGYVLEQILERDVPLVSSQQEYPISHDGRRGVKLDILAEDEDKQFYNLEIQSYTSGSSPIRARFNGTRIDGEFSYPGQKWKDMKDIYIIVICKKDYLKGNQQVYRFERKDENGNPLDDGIHIIYVNGEMESDTPPGRVVHDFYCNGFENMNEGPLKEKAKFLKTSEEEVNRMCEAVERYVIKKVEEAKAEANKRLEVEKAKVKAAEAEKINCIKNMFKAGATIEMISQGFSISPEAVQSLII